MTDEGVLILRDLTDAPEGHVCARAQARLIELSAVLDGMLKAHCRCPDCESARDAVVEAARRGLEDWTAARALAALRTPCPHEPAKELQKRQCARCVEIALGIAYAAGASRAR